jgi:hypothetical protein
MGRRQGTAAAYAKRPASAPSAALPVELASAARRSARVHLFFWGEGKTVGVSPVTAGNAACSRYQTLFAAPATAQPCSPPARCPRPSSPSLAPRPNTTRDGDSRLPKPTGRASGRGPTVSEGRWSCAQLGVPGAVCCLRTGSRYSCSACARRPPPSRRMHPRAGGDRSPPQSPGRCRGLAVSHRLD